MRDEEFLQAVRSGDVANVRKLIAAGAPLDAIDGIQYNGNALHVAVVYENVEMVRALLEAGVDPKFRDICGNTPLDEARDRKLAAVLAVFGKKPAREKPGERFDDFLEEQLGELDAKDKVQKKIAARIRKVDWRARVKSLAKDLPKEAKTIAEGKGHYAAKGMAKKRVGAFAFTWYEAADYFQLSLARATEREEALEQLVAERSGYLLHFREDYEAVFGMEGEAASREDWASYAMLKAVHCAVAQEAILAAAKSAAWKKLPLAKGWRIWFRASDDDHFATLFDSTTGGGTPNLRVERASGD